MTTRRTYIALHVLLTSLATAFVAARFSAKWMRRVPYALDDTLLLIALFALHMHFTGAIVAVSHIHSPVMSQLEFTALVSGVFRWAEYMLTIQMLWLLRFTYAVALTLVRCAIVIFFINTFFTKMFLRLRLAAYSSLGCSVAWAIAVLLTNLLHCRPIWHNWRRPFEQRRYCFPMQTCMIALTVCSLVMDGFIWSLPHFVVWKLQLRTAHKAAITVLFALGLLNILVAIFRILTLANSDYMCDLPYTGVPTILSAFTQISTAIILACLPLLRPFFEKLVPKRLTRIGTRSYTSRSHGSNKIHVTTRIDVHEDSHLPHTDTNVFHEGDFEPWGPKFVVEQNTPIRRRWSAGV